MNWNEKTILVTGSKGFLGSFLVKELEKLCPKKIITPSSKELDLRDNSNCNKIVRDVDIVFHLAGSGGGIVFMRENPADVFYDNILMGTQLIHEAKEAKVKKFIALGGITKEKIKYLRMLNIYGIAGISYLKKNRPRNLGRFL